MFSTVLFVQELTRWVMTVRTMWIHLEPNKARAQAYLGSANACLDVIALWRHSVQPSSQVLLVITSGMSVRHESLEIC